MAFQKKLIFMFTECEGKIILNSLNESIKKIIDKGTVFSQLVSKPDYKTLATCGASSGESIFEAAVKYNLIYGSLEESFNICKVESGSIEDTETLATKVQEKADRSSLIVLIGPDFVVFSGSGVARGRIIDSPIEATSIPATAAYVASFPMPAQCRASILWEVLKDINFKFNEMIKLYESINNIEAAMERKTRQPWDKHDCA